MLNIEERKAIIALIKREVVPAIGCTEPVAVALCVARAKELLGVLPENMSVRLSANILKNAMGVGIPGTGMIGLPIAIALGAIVVWRCSRMPMRMRLKTGVNILIRNALTYNSSRVSAKNYISRLWLLRKIMLPRWS